MSLKRFNMNDGPHEDQLVRKNVISSLKVKLRDSTIKFKKIQESSQKKRSIDFQEPVYNLDDEEEVEKSAQSTHDLIYNEGIESLAKNMIDLSEIFKELNEFVVLQGTILDRIDYSLQCAAENTKQSVKHLKGAEKHQKCTRAVGCIVILLVTIIVLIITLGLKVYL
jgi:syntaxin 16